VQGFKEQIFSGDTRFGMETLLARDTFSFGRYAPSACTPPSKRASSILGGWCYLRVRPLISAS
jgi:hypothetical protein